MHNYHSWTSGIGKRNIQCLIFALSLLNYIIDIKSLVSLSIILNLYLTIHLFSTFQSLVKQGSNTALFDPERRLAVLLSYRLTVFHNKLSTLSLTILGTLAEVSRINLFIFLYILCINYFVQKRFVSFSLSMGFDNDKIARKEMVSYLKLHRLHSNNIVRIYKNYVLVHLYFKNIFLIYR